MKKLLLLALTAVMMAGCKEKTIGEYQGVYVLDSCEYIIYSSTSDGSKVRSVMTHKGNCKFCAERRKQEIKELVECIKKGGEQ